MFTPPSSPLSWPALRVQELPIGSSTRRLDGRKRTALYTAEQRERRDASPWTVVQGILAPMQFAICLVSVGCILHYLATGDGLWIATGSVVVKTAALYAIMITGSIWEKVVFGRYLFAPAFFWEDAVSMLVLALHTAYGAALLTDALQPRPLLGLALVAYASYVINAAQFLLKLRAARLGRPIPVSPRGAVQ